MNDYYDKIIEGAIILGFTKNADDSFVCTKDQIIALCTLVAQEAIRQAKGQ